jgi:antitoxin component YwqK of YwqJK toxin-antitoxin module/peroxiredoxin
MRALLIVGLLACGACTGPKVVTSHFENGQVERRGPHVRGLRDGIWTEYFENGAKKCEGLYANDVQSGSWTWWHANGNKEMEGRFEDEQREGTWTTWHENGALRATGRFERGYEEGWWRFYSPSGAIDHEGAFERGKPVLRWTWYDAGGSVRESGNHHAGTKVGSWTRKDASGATIETVYALPPGCELVEERFDDGTIRRAGFLVDGKPEGRWHTFHPGGKLRFECRFERGEPSGVACAWRDDGSLLASGPLRDGCLAGEWTFVRGDARETLVCDGSRPRPTFGGDWSAASSADLPGWTAVETWLAEACSPRQPAPIRSQVTPASAAQPLASDLSGIPLRAPPWTEYERSVLSELLEQYATGKKRDGGEYEDRRAPAGRSGSPKPANVAKPADLVGRELPVERFMTPDGGEIDIGAYAGKRNVLVTVLRGFGGQVCVYCAAQTKALAQSAADFAALDTEVVVVFPGPKSGVEAFLEAYRRTFGAGEKPPYELVYDADLTLTRALCIEDNFAVPTSLLLDRSGVVRWGYVAKDHADRPAVKSVLEQIKALSGTKR